MPVAVSDWEPRRLRAFEIPKSAILIVPRLATSRFAGFKSRCTTPSSWA